MHIIKLRCLDMLCSIERECHGADLKRQARAPEGLAYVLRGDGTSKVQAMLDACECCVLGVCGFAVTALHVAVPLVLCPLV